MPDPTKKEAAAMIRDAIDSALWAGLKADEVRAVVTAHLIDKEAR
jgi:hypothetical protein